MRRRGVVALFALGVGVGACSGQPVSSEASSTGATGEAIVNGKDSPSPSSQDAAVLLVHTDKSTYFAGCTGTLLAPNLVLTARHCVSDTVDKPFGCESDGTVINDGTGSGVVTTDFKPSDIYVFIGNKRPDFTSPTSFKASARGSKILHDKSTSLCDHDIALIVLDTAIPKAMIAPIRLDSPATAKEKITAVGWGVSTKTPYPDVRQQRVGLSIATIGPHDGTSLSDPPVPPNNFEVGESICQGDSGGPAFDDDTGAVVGVVSRGGNGTSSPSDPSAGCVDTSQADAVNDYTETAPFKDLILSGYQAVGQDPWLEGQPNPLLAKFDDGCEADTDCQSNVCFDGKCSQTCGGNGDSACPDGSECKAEDPGNICVDKAVARTTKSGCGCETVGARGGERGEGGGLALFAIALAVASAITGSRRSRSRSRRDRTRSS